MHGMAVLWERDVAIGVQVDDHIGAQTTGAGEDHATTVGGWCETWKTGGGTDIKVRAKAVAHHRPPASPRSHW